MSDLPIFRIRWSEFEYYVPMRIIIRDWKNLSILRKQYLLIPSEMEYKGRMVELCVPYVPFIRQMRKLPVSQQKQIIRGNAVIELVKAFKRDLGGLKIRYIGK